MRDEQDKLQAEFKSLWTIVSVITIQLALMLFFYYLYGMDSEYLNKNLTGEHRDWLKYAKYDIPMTNITKG